MEQETNVTQTVDTEGISFDLTDIMGEDAPAGQNEEGSRLDKDESGTPTEEAATAEPNEGIEVIHLGETKRLAGDELKNFAQKGMEYDHLKEQLEKFKNNELLKAARESAKLAGLTEEEFAQKLYGQLKDREIEKISKERNIPEEAARTIYEEKSAHKQELEKAGEAQTAAEKELEELREFKRVEMLKETARKEWQEFITKHPDIKSMDDLCESAKTAIKSGRDLESAYAIHENEQLRARLATMEAAAKSPGSAKSTTSAEDPMDDFLKGLSGNW